MLSELRRFALNRLRLLFVLLACLSIAIWLAFHRSAGSDPRSRAVVPAPAWPMLLPSPPGSTLVSVSLGAPVATGGSTSTGTVTVQGARAEKTMILLSSSSPAVRVPNAVVVEAGATTAVFSFVTAAVPSPATATITATEAHSTAQAGQQARTATVTITPALLPVSAPSSSSGQPYAARPVADAPAAQAVAYRTIAGSTMPLTDSEGNVWAPGNAFLSGGTDIVSAGAAVSGTPDQDLYRSQRVGRVFTATFAVPNGNYLLALLFAQVDGTVTGPGQRVCTVTANGQTLLNHFDTYASAGVGTAVSQAVPVTVTNGSLVLTFTGSGTLGTAAVAALQLGLIPAGGGITPSIPGLSQPLPDVPAPPWGSGAVPTDN